MLDYVPDNDFTICLYLNDSVLFLSNERTVIELSNQEYEKAYKYFDSIAFIFDNEFIACSGVDNFDFWFTMVLETSLYDSDGVFIGVDKEVLKEKFYKRKE